MPDALNTKPVQSPREPPAAKRLSDLALRFTLGKLNANECDHTTLIALIAWLLLKSDEAIATQRIISGLRGLDRSGCPPLAFQGRFFRFAPLALSFLLLAVALLHGGALFLGHGIT